MQFDLSKRYCYYFNEISKIPHGSRNEKGISDFIVNFAKEHNLTYKQDEVYNVIIEKPASSAMKILNQLFYKLILIWLMKKIKHLTMTLTKIH